MDFLPLTLFVKFHSKALWRSKTFKSGLSRYLVATCWWSLKPTKSVFRNRCCTTDRIIGYGTKYLVDRESCKLHDGSSQLSLQKPSVSSYSNCLSRLTSCKVAEYNAQWTIILDHVRVDTCTVCRIRSRPRRVRLAASVYF